MAGQRLGPSLALVQKCGWLELAQSCWSVHLQAPWGSGPRPEPLCPTPPPGLPALPPPQGASPGLQSAPAAVGISCAHAVPAGGVYLTRRHLHAGHLQAEGAQLSKGAAPLS